MIMKQRRILREKVYPPIESFQRQEASSKFDRWGRIKNSTYRDWFTPEAIGVNPPMLQIDEMALETLYCSSIVNLKYRHSRVPLFIPYQVAKQMVFVKIDGLQTEVVPMEQTTYPLQPIVFNTGTTRKFLTRARLAIVEYALLKL